MSIKKKEGYFIFPVGDTGNSKAVESVLIILKLKIASYVALCNLKFIEGVGGLLLSPIILVQFCIIFREKDYIRSYPFIDIMAEFTQASDNR